MSRPDLLSADLHRPRSDKLGTLPASANTHSEGGDRRDAPPAPFACYEDDREAIGRPTGSGFAIAFGREADTQEENKRARSGTKPRSIYTSLGT